MYPDLFRVGPFVAHSYGALLALSFLLGVFWSIRRAKKWGIDAKIILDLAVVVFVCSIVGARIFYVLFHLYEFKGHWLNTISPLQSNGEIGIGGLSMLGGVVLSVVGGIVFLRLKKQNVWRVADVVTPAFPLGILLTRIGCYLNGCCFGKPAGESGWGVIFPEDSPAGYTFPEILIYPTQLFSSFKGLVLLIVLLVAERYRKFDGFSFWIMLFLFSLGRFIIDFFRYYESSMVLFSLKGVNISVNQGVTLFLMIVSFLAWLRLKKATQKSV